MLAEKNNIILMNKFIPFEKINNQNVVVVDAFHSNALVLSHWRGANIHSEIWADTSGEIVLNALSTNYCDKINGLVTANHFDIDGFVGVFALCYPDLALKHKSVLTEAAKIGDFREFNKYSNDANEALKLCCWINSREKENFYRPFGEKSETKLCNNKFSYFLKLFPKVLEDINKFKSDWIQEYNLVINGINQIDKSCEIFPKSEIGLLIQKCKNPTHYYSHFINSSGFDAILSIYNNQRYELEYKYTTWVDIVSRPTLPRISLKPLAIKLNELENSSSVWCVDHYTDTGPILRLEKDKISKADRYDSPSNRPIYSSSIKEEILVDIVTSYFKQALEDIKPKKFWTWDEIKAINRNFTKQFK